jgi:hypothetical protein
VTKNTGPVPSGLLKRGLLFLPVTIFVCTSLYYFSQFHVSPLSRDQWHLYSPYFERGLLDAALLPASDHRHIFPYLFFHVDMNWFHGLNHFLVAFGGFFCVLLSLIFISHIKKHQDLSSHEQSCIVIFCLTFLFWLINAAQLGWGFMSSMYYFSAVLFFLSISLANHLEQNISTKFTVLSITAGILCTFSFGIGILVWPSIIILLSLQGASLARQLPYAVSFIACLLLFFLLPGGDNVSETLKLDFTDSLKFGLTLAAGPIYYLLKGFSFPENLCEITGLIIAVPATLAGVAFFAILLLRRAPLVKFDVICLASMLLYYGSSALISFSRNSLFLDVFVDRYQIWAMFFWLGFIPLIYRKYLGTHFPRIARLALVLMLLFPVAAYPSQMNLGVKLAEYKNRVNGSLLVLRAGYFHERDLKSALHWNWITKLPHFLYTFSKINEHNKNIFWQYPYPDFSADLKSVENLPVQPGNTLFKLVASDIISKSRQMDPEPYIKASNANKAWLPDWKSPLRTGNGYRLKLKADHHHWQFGVITDEHHKVIGLLQPVKHSLLPRGNLKFQQTRFNTQGVIELEHETKKLIALIYDRNEKQEGAFDITHLLKKLHSTKDQASSR